MRGEEKMKKRRRREGRKREGREGKEVRKGRDKATVDSELNLTRAKASFCSQSLSCGGRSLRAGRSGDKRSDE